MITIKDYMEAIDYRVSGGSEYQWDVFGAGARYMDCDIQGDDGMPYASINMIFDAKNQSVYQMEAWDYDKDRVYRWTHPDYLDAYKAECQRRGVAFEIASDDKEYVDLEVADDLLEKASAIANQEEYDTRCQVELTLADEQVFELMRLAHENDVTLNQMVESMLREYIDHQKMLRDWV
jgi:hypothetical protein